MARVETEQVSKGIHCGGALCALLSSLKFTLMKRWKGTILGKSHSMRFAFQNGYLGDPVGVGLEGTNLEAIMKWRHNACQTHYVIILNESIYVSTLYK